MGAQATPEGIKVQFEGLDGTKSEGTYDLVLQAVGRTPNGKKIAADKAGVAVTDRGFINVDIQMRTNVPHIFAIGDIVGQPMLAHKAVHEAHVAAEVIAGELQGNKELAQHFISRAKCLKGLEGITIQTEEQKATCGGFANMVPIHKKGRKSKACIDVFEFPNQPCALPVVWTAPVQAKVICELQGKRLCSQEEWILACRGDPDDGKDRRFAYGDEMDLEICNTHKSGAKYSPNCDPDSASSAWKTCATNTEPAGSFPGCRSRFGVFDQHGNVAEIMTRLDPDGHTYSQLKGSAFFYTDVARKPDERQVKGRETYPDHCAHDPRWHVELMSEAWHVNYHLGFRCCKTVK